ncbi:hypothetical protein EV207_101130 [Scopulibacillus darangshiensis]|uniref:Uncharacterized protein n=1 Tax=Scopulibacillus darangshiensis TaxID=442528 RepID=A0A4R2PAX9_9BACL|nr:hypothetical protein [Scopulibacillus darangshiensis]TCP32152.1 hypothetical protein EV207_101130 [Scopulibacillus darangshiensis]
MISTKYFVDLLRSYERKDGFDNYFIGVVKSVADLGTIDDLKAVVAEYEKIRSEKG